MKRYFEKLSFKLDENVTEKSLDYLIELWDSISDYLRLPSLPYLLDQVHDGCISVTWLVPPISTPGILLMTDEPEAAKYFSKLGIIRMEINDLCLYEKQELSVETKQSEEQVKFTYWTTCVVTYMYSMLHS